MLNYTNISVQGYPRVIYWEKMHVMQVFITILANHKIGLHCCIHPILPPWALDITEHKLLHLYSVSRDIVCKTIRVNVIP